VILLVTGHRQRPANTGKPRHIAGLTNLEEIIELFASAIDFSQLSDVTVSIMILYPASRGRMKATKKALAAQACRKLVREVFCGAESKKGSFNETAPSSMPTRTATCEQSTD